MYRLLVTYIDLNTIFPTGIRKFSNIKFIKIHIIGNQFFRADKRRDRQTDCHEEANRRFSIHANVCTKFVYERLWAMLCVDCDVCTGVVGDSGKN